MKFHRPHRYRWLSALGVLTVGGVLAASWYSSHARAATLLKTDPDAILANARLLAAAVRIARPQYQAHCASCHGASLHGDAGRGVPDLARHAWLYGDDPIDVERTILYGIRSGHPKARNVVDMPAMVRSGQLSTGDAHAVVEYLQRIAGRPHDQALAAHGGAIYNAEGNCYDCHSSDARGITDYGAPALTGPVYLYGGDRDTLFRSVQNGRHGECPAWIDRLSPVQIRSLALYMVAAARPALPPGD